MNNYLISFVIIKLVKTMIVINNATASSTYLNVKEKLGISKLGNVYLSKHDVDLILQTQF